MFEPNFIEPLEIEGIIVAIVSGFIIGIERQWSEKPAGIRTSILICLSAYIFVSIGQYYRPNIGSMRIVGQIVTGVGFLGAGVILAKEGLVLGVTSAAVIWILASVGSLIGLGNYWAAICISLLTVLVLVFVNLLERRIFKIKRGVHKDQKKKENQ